jgi:hypothetical protein
MTRFQGFETKEEAKAFQKKNGGILCGKESRIKQDREYWQMAVNFGGMNEKYVWCVQWNERTR